MRVHVHVVFGQSFNSRVLRDWKIIAGYQATYTVSIAVESESEEESAASDDKVEDPEKVSGTLEN